MTLTEIRRMPTDPEYLNSQRSISVEETWRREHMQDLDDFTADERLPYVDDFEG